MGILFVLLRCLGLCQIVEICKGQGAFVILRCREMKFRSKVGNGACSILLFFIQMLA